MSGITPLGELKHPAPEGSIESGTHTERRIRRQHGFHGVTHDPRPGQWQHVAGTNVATVPMRRPTAQCLLIDQRDIATRLAQVIRRGATDDTRSDDDDVMHAGILGVGSEKLGGGFRSQPPRLATGTR